MKPPNSPPLRVLLGVLVVEAVISVGTLAWNLWDRRDDVLEWIRRE